MALWIFIRNPSVLCLISWWSWRGVACQLPCGWFAVRITQNLCNFELRCRAVFLARTLKVQDWLVPQASITPSCLHRIKPTRQKYEHGPYFGLSPHALRGHLPRNKPKWQSDPFHAMGLCGSRKFANHRRNFGYYSLWRFLRINGKADLLTVELGHTELPTQTPTRLEEKRKRNANADNQDQPPHFQITHIVSITTLHWNDHYCRDRNVMHTDSSGNSKQGRSNKSVITFPALEQLPVRGTCVYR